MSQALHPMLNIAVKAARAAGAIINRASLDLDRLQVSTKSTNDFVTEVDHAAEAAIIDMLLGAYPGHGILAEESGSTRGAKDSDYVWIIDPLDGTTNFIHGLPTYAVSIGLAFRGQMQQAVVYDPARNDLFYATKGRGAFLNDKRLRVSKRTRMADALIGTGFPFRKGDDLDHYLQMLELVMQSCAGVRRPGAAALDLCYVAAGWYDGFFETGLSPWDVAAGSLIVTEAGGLVGNFTGEADFLHQREVVAGTPEDLRPAGADARALLRHRRHGLTADRTLACGSCQARAHDGPESRHARGPLPARRDPSLLPGRLDPRGHDDAAPHVGAMRSALRHAPDAGRVCTQRPAAAADLGDADDVSAPRPSLGPDARVATPLRLLALDRVGGPRPLARFPSVREREKPGPRRHEHNRRIAHALNVPAPVQRKRRAPAPRREYDRPPTDKRSHRRIDAGLDASPRHEPPDRAALPHPARRR